MRYINQRKHQQNFKKKKKEKRKKQILQSTYTPTLDSY